jgi:3-deoxy-D-manno-octulosonic acid (KDO) 8-phosphate synthase
MTNTPDILKKIITRKEEEVAECKALALETAAYLKQVTEDLGINFIYKSSYDKANRTSTSSFRGLGIVEGGRRGCRV